MSLSLSSYPSPSTTLEKLVFTDLIRFYNAEPVSRVSSFERILNIIRIEREMKQGGEFLHGYSERIKSYLEAEHYYSSSAYNNSNHKRLYFKEETKHFFSATKADAEADLRTYFTQVSLERRWEIYFWVMLKAKYVALYKNALLKRVVIYEDRFERRPKQDEVEMGWRCVVPEDVKNMSTENMARIGQKKRRIHKVLYLDGQGQDVSFCYAEANSKKKRKLS